MVKKADARDKDAKGLSVKKNEDISEWYTQVVQKAELADYAPIKGFMIVRPNGYAIWEEIQRYFDKVLKTKRIRNAYFPMLIPEGFFRKEAEHAKGFAPELAYIEGKEEGERLALRPTSEAIIYDSYSKWIRSWRDLPLLINQWANVFRMEVKQTKPFLRTREFLWQEGHCVFADEKEAEKNMMEIIEEYRRLVEDVLAIPVVVGKKSKMETFAGAIKTMAIEALMPDGKALQMGTSHNLGQGFSRSFGIKFQDEKKEEKYAWQTSWGFSTRLIGAIAMIHGDDHGLVIPPRVAVNKAVIVPILFEDSREKVLKTAKDIKSRLDKFGAFLDDREEYKPGWKFNEWELKGIPLRIEIGPKDVIKKQVMIIRRDNGKKEVVREKDVAKRVSELLEQMQSDLYRKAKEFLDSKIDNAKTFTELKKKLRDGKIVKVFLVDDVKLEEKLKAETGGASSRIIEDSKKEGKCIVSGQKTKSVAWIAKSY